MHPQRMLRRVIIALTLMISLPGAASTAVPSPLQGQPHVDRVDLDAVAIRILLGVPDKEPTRWDAEVKLTAGEM